MLRESEWELLRECPPDVTGGDDGEPWSTLGW